MGRFEDLMGKPLPSQIDNNDLDFDFTESCDDLDTDFDFDEDGDDIDDVTDAEFNNLVADIENEEHIDADGDDEDIDSLDSDDEDEDSLYNDDEEDDSLDNEEDEEEDEDINININIDEGDEDCGDDSCKNDDIRCSKCGNLKDTCTCPAEPLTGEADVAADNMMAIAATPLLLKDELTAAESAEFFESVDADIAVEEGFLLESDAMDIFEEGYKFAPANRKYMMTKQARYNQLYELALQIEARNHNDPKYKKLQKAYKIERQIKAGFRKKYHALATRRAKLYLKRLMKSKSPILNRLGKSISK